MPIESKNSINNLWPTHPCFLWSTRPFSHPLRRLHLGFNIIPIKCLKSLQQIFTKARCPFSSFTVTWARAHFSGCSSTTNAHIETRQMPVCCQKLTLGSLISRSALCMLVGALFKKWCLFLNTPRTSVLYGKMFTFWLFEAVVVTAYTTRWQLCVPGCHLNPLAYYYFITHGAPTNTNFLVKNGNLLHLYFIHAKLIFKRAFHQLSNGIRHVMPSTDRRLELKAKNSDGLDRLTAGCVCQWVKGKDVT